MRITICLLLAALLLGSCYGDEKKEQAAAVEVFLNQTALQQANSVEKLKRLDSVFAQYERSPNTLENRLILFKITATTYNLGLEERYLSNSKKILEKSTAARDSIHIAKALYYIGDYFENQFKSDSAYAYYSKSNKVYINLQDKPNMGRTSLYKANILYDEGLYPEAEIEATKAVSSLYNSGEQRLLYESYVTLANVLAQNHEYPESLKYHRLALERLKGLKSRGSNLAKQRQSLASCYNNIGYVYNNMQQYEEATQYFDEALRLLEHTALDSDVTAMVLNNLAHTQIQRHQLAKAWPLLEASKHIRDSLPNPHGRIASQLRYGDYYLAARDTNRALAYWKQAWLAAVEIKAQNAALKSLENLSLYDRVNGNHYAFLHFDLKDKIEKSQLKTRAKFARIEFETHQIEKKNQILIQQNTLLTWGYAAVGLLCILLLTSIYFMSKNKKLRDAQKQQQSDAVIYQLLLQQEQLSREVLKRERGRMSRELHDGIVNKLFNIKLQLFTLEASDLKNNLLQEIESSEKQIRQISHDLVNQSVFDNNFSNLAAELLASQADSQIAFESFIDKKMDWNALNYQQKINLYRSIQEALHNVNKHSKATHCSVTIYETQDEFVFKIQDNGKGIDLNKEAKGIGIQNIKIRIAEILGSVEIISEVEKGTLVKICVPKSAK